MTTQATHQVFAVHPRDKIHADLFGANCFTLHDALCSSGYTRLLYRLHRSHEAGVSKL